MHSRIELPLPLIKSLCMPLIAKAASTLDRESAASRQTEAEDMIGRLTVGSEEAQLAHAVLQIIPEDHNLLQITWKHGLQSVSSATSITLHFSVCAALCSWSNIASAQGSVLGL